MDSKIHEFMADVEYLVERFGGDHTQAFKLTREGVFFDSKADVLGNLIGVAFRAEFRAAAEGRFNSNWLKLGEACEELLSEDVLVELPSGGVYYKRHILEFFDDAKEKDPEDPSDWLKSEIDRLKSSINGLKSELKSPPDPDDDVPF